MTSDLLLVTGMILAVLSGVSLMTAWIDGRRPRVASIVVVISGGLILWGATTSPGGFSFDDIPRAFVNVIGAILN
ncbi:MAG: hypothetical protein Q9M41_03435 [Paracoccaceae bacterium]|nr:hypothetical protein [Paracoccaceae bacterium]